MSAFAEPDDGFKPAWHDAYAGEVFDEGAPEDNLGTELRCEICNARPGQPHLATGRYA